MDTFQIKYSIQKYSYSQAYKHAVDKDSLWTDEHVKLRLIHEKPRTQTLDSFMEQYQLLKTQDSENIQLRIQFVINDQLLDKMIKHRVNSSKRDLFLSGTPHVFEYVEEHKLYNWGLFLIKRFRGESFTFQDMDVKDEALYQEELQNDTQIYCCGHCADRKCPGGFEVKIIRKPNDIVWDWTTYRNWKNVVWSIPNFCFDKNQYEAEFAEYQLYLVNQLKDV